MRILYLTFNAPPVKNIVSFRTEGYLKYLPEFGVEVDVLTRHYDDLNFIATDFEAMKSDVKTELPKYEGGNIHYTGFYNYVSHSKYYNVTKSFFRAIYNLILVDPYYYGWKKIALEYFDSILSKNKYDLIIATYNPLITFVVAQKISKKYNIPWIAEFRDSFILEEDKGKKLFYKKIFQSLALKGVSKIITVSEAMKSQLNQTLTGLNKNKEIIVIRNGYDESVVPAIDINDEKIWNLYKGIKNQYDKVILHTGTLYSKQDYQFFHDSLTKFNSSNSYQIAIVYVGLNKDGMSFNSLLHKDVFVFPKVSHSTSLYMQSDADFLMMPSWHQNSTRSFPAKVYEYIWFGKKVLCNPYPPDDFKEFITQFQNVNILKDYKDFENIIKKENRTESYNQINIIENKSEKEQLTRRYWMHKLAKNLSYY